LDHVGGTRRGGAREPLIPQARGKDHGMRGYRAPGFLSVDQEGVKP
jgi:hypothetical protein